MTANSRVPMWFAFGPAPIVNNAPLNAAHTTRKSHWSQLGSRRNANAALATDRQDIGTVLMPKNMPMMTVQASANATKAARAIRSAPERCQRGVIEMKRPIGPSSCSKGAVFLHNAGGLPAVINDRCSHATANAANRRAGSTVLRQRARDGGSRECRSWQADSHAGLGAGRAKFAAADIPGDPLSKFDPDIGVASHLQIDQIALV
jgi:hypothetical protein